MLFKFLAEFAGGIRRTYNIIVMDEGRVEDPRQYRLKSSSLLQFWLASMLAAGLLMIMIVAVTPLREYMPSQGTAEMQRQIRINALRVAALRDSLEAQLSYAAHLRRLMIGQVDSSMAAQADEAPWTTVSGSNASSRPASAASSSNWGDHQQPALPVPRLSLEGSSRIVPAGSVEQRYLSSIRFPTLPPVEGVLTRGFDARAGHYAVDIAAETGSIIRSIGDGHVIFADWAHEGGYTITIQHADGYVSVYKHAQRLLKRVGDRVRNREAVAISGNSGEITTGPHVHVEIWYNGLAQDPRYFFVGW